MHTLRLMLEAMNKEETTEVKHLNTVPCSFHFIYPITVDALIILLFISNEKGDIF